MADQAGNPSPHRGDTPTRRRFLKQLGQGAVAGGAAAPLLAGTGRALGQDVSTGQVKYRTLGKTDLAVSEIGFGGHSWAYKRVPDGAGGYRQVTIDEAVEMIAAGIDMGVNFFDSCTPLDESAIPGEALRRLKKRDDVIVSIRVSHKMKGTPNDRQEIYKWTEDRLKLWHTDYVDLCLLCNTENDTKLSGYWDMSYSMEALDKLKQQGKIRFTGFGCHFTPHWFRQAFEKYGDYFDICSMPYNVRHAAAKELLPEARQKKMGTITIKPFARGSLLKKRDLTGADAGLPRDMIAFVLEDENVDICTCGVHTLDQVKENFSASWTEITPEGRKRLEAMSGTPVAGKEHAWLEEGWLYA
jgi:aryl-alcohol dehydrogenase-like predicted oxidoreductase